MGLSAGFIGISVGIVTFKYYGSDMREGSSIQEYWGPRVGTDVTAKNVLLCLCIVFIYSPTVCSTAI